MRSIRSLVTVSACAAVAFGGVSLLLPASAGAVPSAKPSWHLVKAVTGSNFPEFSAATSWSAIGAWAFVSNDIKGKPLAYKLSGGAWHKESFPGLKGESVWSATSSSAGNVWAFTVTAASKERVLRYNGHAWSVVPTSGKLINSGLALSSKDVWIFGSKFGFSTGTVHYNGTSFTRLRSGAGLFGGSALSSKSIWAYGVNTVAHWNGSTWKSTSVAGLLSKSCGNVGFLEGILAVSSSDVLAVGAGGCSDNHGPLVLLRFNGTSWHRLKFAHPIAANPLTIIGDGSGGAWIPVLTGSGEPTSSIYHFTGHSIGKASLPVSSKHLELDGAAIATGTTTALAFGLTRNAADTKWTAVLLRFEA